MPVKVLQPKPEKTAEQALTASEFELRALFASMQDVVLVIDREGVYRKIAPTNPALLVRPPEELLGKNLRDVFPAEQAETFLTAMRQVLETQQSKRIEYELLIGEHPTWFATSISPMTEDTTLWVARDITERKQAEDALRESEEKYRTLIEQQQAIVYIDKLDGKGTTVFISQQVEAILGVSVEEWLQRDLSIWSDLIHPEDRQRVLDGYQQLVMVGQMDDIEYRVIKRDGKLVWIHEKGQVLRGGKGELLLLGVMLDITEHKRAEEKMRALSTRQEAILAAVPDILMEVDKEKVYTWANPAGIEFFGEDMIGREASFYFEGEQATYDIVLPLFEGDENIIYVESWQRRKDGEKRLLA